MAIDNTYTYKPGIPTEWSLRKLSTEVDNIRQVVDTFTESGGTGVDLSGYVTQSQLTNALQGVNHAPLAVADAYTGADSAQNYAGNVLTNDADVDPSDTKAVTAVTYNGTAQTVGSAFQTQFGTAVISANGAWTFVPNAAARLLSQGQGAVITISYTMRDAVGAASTSVLTISVTGSNSGPIVQADALLINYGASTDFSVLVNDTDPEGGALSVASYSVGGLVFGAGQSASLAFGTIVIRADGTGTITPANGFQGPLPSITYEAVNTYGSTTGSFAASVKPPASDVLPNPVVGRLVGTGTTYDIHNDEDGHNTPWSMLGPGDVVNVHYSVTPYRGKWALRARGTLLSWVVINGVTDASGNRPVFYLGPGCFSYRGCNPSGGYGGPDDMYGSSIEYSEGLAGILVKRPADDPDKRLPQYIKIQGLHIKDAAGTFTTVMGATAPYAGAGSANRCNGLYLYHGQDITVENCVITGNSNGLFVMAKLDSFEHTVTRLVLRSNRIYDNGVEGSFLEHNVYNQSSQPIIEGNYIGQLRPGAIGASYKGRCSNEIIRYNWFHAAARALDLVQAQDQDGAIDAEASYDYAFVYGNVIINDTRSARGGSWAPVHWGGDHADDGTNSAQEVDYRKRLYFWNNTYFNHVDQSAGIYSTPFFQVALSDGHVYAWNNIFVVGGTSRHSWTNHAGHVHLLGKNVVVGTVEDAHSSALAANYQIHKDGTLITADPAFMDLTTYQVGITTASSAIDQATAVPSGLPEVGIDITHPIEYQPRFGANGLVARTIDGPASDIGAIEFGVGYTPPPPPVPSASPGPLLNGTSAEGSTVTASYGTWAGRPALTGALYVDGILRQAMSNGATYVSTSADVGKNLTLVVTGVNTTGTTTLTSPALRVTSSSAPANITPPAISAPYVVDQTSAIDPGTWANSPTAYQYQVLRDGVAVSAPSGSPSYTFTMADYGHAITPVVYATNAVDTSTQSGASVTPTLPQLDPDSSGRFNFAVEDGRTVGSLSSSFSGAVNYMTVSSGALQVLAGRGTFGDVLTFALPAGDQSVAMHILGGWSGSLSLGINSDTNGSGYVFAVTQTGWGLRRTGTYIDAGNVTFDLAQPLEVKVARVGTQVQLLLKHSGATSYSVAYTYNDATPITTGGVITALFPGDDVTKMRMDWFSPNPQ